LSSRRGLEIRAANAADAPGLAELLASADLSMTATDVAGRIDAVRQGSGAILVALEWGPPSGVIALHWFARLDAQAARVAGCGSMELAAKPEQSELHAFCHATGFLDLGTRFERALRKSSSD
jgi:hypothetical protein